MWLYFFAQHYFVDWRLLVVNYNAIHCVFNLLSSIKEDTFMGKSSVMQFIKGLMQKYNSCVDYLNAVNSWSIIKHSALDPCGVNKQDWIINVDINVTPVGKNAVTCFTSLINTYSRPLTSLTSLMKSWD